MTPGKHGDKTNNFSLQLCFRFKIIGRKVVNHVSSQIVNDVALDRTPVPTVQNSVPSRFVSTFKRFCNKEYGVNIWQYRSNDHIIRNRQDYEEHLRYIYENPIRWYYDELYAEE